MMARPLSSSSTTSKSKACKDMKDDPAYLDALAAQRTANAFFEKYDKRDLQELLSFTTCSWLLCREFSLQADSPPGIIRQMNQFAHSKVVILAPADPRMSLDYKVVHQILRELTIGIYCFNQVPSLSLEANYDRSTSCQLTPAYLDTKVGQILIDIDYTMKGLWHGACIPKEKRLRFSELWRSSMGVDVDGVPQTKKDILAEFLTAGLVDITEDPCYQGIYKNSGGSDPTYDPSSPVEQQLFSRHLDSILLKLTAYLSCVQQHENLFVFEAEHSLSSAVRLPEDQLSLADYQRLRQRLGVQERMVRGGLGRKMETCANLAYLRLIAFLVPLLAALKKSGKIPDLSQVLPPHSADKLKTEREVPPLLLGANFTCKHFTYSPDEYFHLHGGIALDVGTPPLDSVDPEIKGASEVIKSLASDHLSDLLSQKMPYRENFRIPVKEFNGKRYHLMAFGLDALQSQRNKTQWWEAMGAAIKTLKGKRLPLTDVQLHEQFKKTFGYKKAIKCKSVLFGLRAAAERGLAAAFHTLCRRNSPTQLGATDEHGYSLAHYAALHNHPHVLCQLVAAGISLNTTRNEKLSTVVKHMMMADVPGVAIMGATPMHLAAQCGSLDAINCLLALQGDYRAAGPRGWTAVHFAAYYGQVMCLKALCRRDQSLAEMPTAAQYRTYPLLLTASSGSVEALEFLLSLGVDRRRRDSEGHTAVHLAALYFHTCVLRVFIRLGLEELSVWRTLVDMLGSEDSRKAEMSIRCLEALSLTVESFWENFVDADGVPVLLGLLRDSRPTLQCMVVAVLCHVSERAAVCGLLMESGTAPLLVPLLSSCVPELQSRCALVLADLVTHTHQASALVTTLGGIAPLVQLLGLDVQDVLLNAVRCIRALCVRSPHNQSAVAQAGGIPPLVQFLTIQSDVLQELACEALAELARGHAQNQDAICVAGVVEPLVEMLRRWRVSAQLKAGQTLQALVEHNPAVQACFLESSADTHLLLLLKVFQLDVKEQAVESLWALAGQAPQQQRRMAERIGYHFILELLLSSSEKMQYVGCQAAMALSRDSRSHQDGLCREDVVPPLVRLLRGSRTTERNLLCVIRTLGGLCIGEAHTNNLNSQKLIAEEKAIPVLVNLLRHHRSVQIKVQVAQTLACLVLGNPKLQMALWDQTEVIHSAVLELQQAQDRNTCLEAGYALSVFAYNNVPQQSMMLRAGGISMVTYEPFLQSDAQEERAKAAFQIVVLAKVIVDLDQVTLTATGVTVLVDLLQSHSTATIKLSAQFLASLAHTRAGIPDAIATMGAVQHLCAHMYSKEEEVCTACACALGYLTFNRYAHRLLLVECRNTPALYKLLMRHLGENAKISKVFTAEFRRQHLEINGGPSVPEHKGRPKTTSCTLGTWCQGPRDVRSRSAPVLLQRARSKTASVRLQQATVPQRPPSPGGGACQGQTLTL